MRSGFVPVVGRPNVGKSTLVNALVGTKVAITSPRPQTTRSTIRGIVTRSGENGSPTHQLLLVDTPGLHKPRTQLGDRLNLMVYGTLSEADVVAFVVDGTQPIGTGDRLIAERVSRSGTPTVLVVSKVDLAGPARVAEQLAVASHWDLDGFVPVSAVTGEKVGVLLEELASRLPEGPLYFPADRVTDQPNHLLAAEIVREKFLGRLREELPHSLVVVVEQVEEREDGLVTISAAVVVERSSQKGIVIGKGGSLLGAAGEEARRELEARFGARVQLDLRVRVEKDWQRSPQLLDRLGFGG
ncbi:MAG: GTPase Era [Acidimicrobiia bacterium]